MPPPPPSGESSVVPGSDATTPRVLLAVPIYNEAGHVDRVLDRLRHVALPKLFVDDGSTDGTSERLADAPGLTHLRHPTNRGYGAALCSAFAFAGDGGFDWVVTMDCDEQHDPAALPAFLREIARDDADLVSGSRYLAAGSEDDLPPPERRAVNVVVTNLLNRLFGVTLTDSFCGFKAHRVSATLALGLDEPGYAFPLQLWPRVLAAGQRVKEIPVRRIYTGAARTFGHDVRAGDLDDARVRLRHYLDVLRGELCLAGRREVGEPLVGEALAGAMRELASPDEPRVSEDLRLLLRDGTRTGLLAPCP